jgi:hypothetical protein
METVTRLLEGPAQVWHLLVLAIFFGARKENF